MRPADFAREALADLRASKLRSLLTGLGVIIGVGSVTLLLSLGEGVRAQVAGTFVDLGSTRLIVGPAGGDVGPASSTITLDDVAAIEAVDGVLDVAPNLNLALPVATTGDPVRLPAVGTRGAYFEIAGDELVAGEPFGGGGAVLDESAVRTLFGEIGAAAAVGRTIEAAETTLTVSGVVEDPPFANGGGFGPGGGGGTTGSERSGVAYLPVEVLMDAADQEYVTQVNLRAVDAERVEEVRLAVLELMEERHGVRDVQVVSLARVLDRVNEALSVITGFLAALAGISLLVGGIGIMNIMLAVVAERTREIGIARALGATRRAVILQFLTEAIFISLLGGIVGLLLALAAAAGIDAALGVPAIVSPAIVGLALGVSTAIGVLFGVLPAWRAARLDPIRALRHD
ncbi:MAG: macrolide export ATP-binding/permease protein MacB [Chloroflexota bacterium]